jgi:copper chaperone
MERTTFDIEGMSCGHCVAAVSQALKELPGVEVERVTIGSATVAYDPGAISVERITAAIRSAGYEPAEGTAG